MPSSQTAATERRNERIVTHEPPKLKTTLKTPPKQATNPLQFVKVGPCSLYRTAQEQLQKVQEVKKIKQEVRDDPEDWQSNLDNWKSSRRKRQEHIIERVVEVKKLELEEHDRQRRRSKTFSEMMEERGSRGRKLSMSLAMYHEEDANDLSDLGIGTSSGKSSVSGDTHDDTQSVLSDRDSEIEKNHSDLESVANENGNANENMNRTESDETPATDTSSRTSVVKKPSSFADRFRNDNDTRAYDPVIPATASSPEPEEYTYEGAIRGYVSRVTQNIPRRSLVNLDVKLDNANPNDNEETGNEDKNSGVAVVKVDVLKRREIFEKAAQIKTETRANNINNNNNNNNNNNVAHSSSTKSIKERLSSLEKQSGEVDSAEKDARAIKRLSGDMSSIRERFSHLEKQTSERESKVSSREASSAELESARRLSGLEKYGSESPKIGAAGQATFSQNGDGIAAAMFKDRLVRLDASAKSKEASKKNPLDKQLMRFINEENSTPSERSLSPDTEYRVPRAAFHRSLDSLDADASSGPDTFERVQSLEELDYSNRYPPSSSSAELLNDTDREDSGIHTADVSCAVSQADENVEEELVHQPETIVERQETTLDDEESLKTEERNVERITEESNVVEVADSGLGAIAVDGTQQAATSAVATKESIAADSSDEEIRSGDETSPSVEYEEVGIDGPTMDLADLEDSVSESVKSNKPQQQIIGDQREPESPRPVPLPVQLSPFSNKTLTFGEPDFFGTLSPSSKQIPQMNVSTDEEFVTGMTFPLGPSTNVEPPKEKPPPPPTDLSDEESLPVEPLKRLNSTRRIKKELRTRRSDFLGIEGINDDDLEREVTLTRPPDMASILAAERRIEQLDRRSYDTDSNYEQDSSHERDSGVELGHTEDWSKQPVSPDMSQHSRQSSEPFGASVTSSEEDEITKKEREIIEVLEKEEQWRYGNDREQNSDIGEKLAHKLRELEEEKMQLERNRAQETELHRHEESLRNYDENDRKQEEDALRKQQQEMARQQREAERVAETAKRAEEKKLREEELMRMKTEQLRTQGDVELQERRSTELRRQENVKIRSMGGHARGHDSEQMAINTKREDDFASGEVLRVERELLQLEQEELKRRRSNMAYREQRQLQLAEQLQEQWQSLQDVANVSNRVGNPSHYKYVAAQVNHRSSMPNLQLHEGQKRRPPPPPIPPSKPSRLVEQMQRDVTIRNSRIPSADSIPQQVEDGLGRTGSTTTMSNHAGQQMTRETLHALSAVPRPRIVKGDQWVQRRKSDVPRGTQEYNYQHWLIQEAEQRRINEKNQRTVGRKPQQHVTGTSVPYAGSSATRPDGKPLPDSIIQTLTQRVQNRVQERPPPPRRRLEQSTSHEHLSSIHQQTPQHVAMVQHPKVHQYPAGSNADTQEKMLSVSGKKKCSHCGDELGRGAAMIIESLRLFYHMECFKCCVCHVRLGDGLMGTDVRVRNHKLHCHNCYSSDDGVKFSCV